MISERKYQILCHCNVVASGPKATSEALKTNVSNVMFRMAEDDLLSVEDGMYLTTPNGRIEARLFRDAASRITPAPKINKFDGVYTPTTGYQRNNGLVHIPSRGFPC
jgi:hypothetical protein